MSGEIHDECGVVGAYFFDPEGDVMPLLYKMLLHLQNRGQLSSGITTYSKKRSKLLKTYKQIGTVNEVFLTKDSKEARGLFRKYAGRVGIGHVRYSTFGKAEKEYAHPFERPHGIKSKWYSFCFNGNIANYNVLKEKLLENENYHLTYNTDSEIIMHYLARELDGFNHSKEKLPDLRELFSRLSSKFDGAYSLAYLDAEGRLVALRDPLGLRPLCYSRDSEKVLFASESVALKNLGCKNIQSLHPGEILIVEGNSVRIENYAASPRRAHCMFEYIYFANVASTIEGKSVYVVRANLGREMAKLETETVNPEDYVVVSVPDSSKPFGEGYAYALGLPHREGLVRNRFTGRTFIEESGRREKVKNKFSIIREVIRGKKVLLMDDSIVRGTTSQQLVKFLREMGEVKEIHFRVSCPPIVSPCFYGIDMSSFSELIASRFHHNIGRDMEEEACRKMAAEIGADTLIYMKLEGIPRAIGIPKEGLCMACINGEYPTPYGETLCKIALENDGNKGIVSCKRTYE